MTHSESIVMPISMEYDNMNEKLTNIEAIIEEIIDYMKLETDCRHYINLCKNYDKAHEIEQLCKQRIKQLLNLLIEQINQYINYPIEKKWFYTKQKQAQWRYTREEAVFNGYVVKIPYIDKQEYYCIKCLLTKYQIDNINLNNVEYLFEY